MKCSTKRLLSMVIVLAMALSMLPMIASAEAPTTLYVKPNANWNQSGARFAAYFFGAGETWVDCTDADGDGVYEVTVPAGGYTHIIFCRMNPNAAANTWNNKWNQTKDLPLADTSAAANCYVVADGSWDKGNGQWVEYVPGGQVETEPTTASPIKYSVAGEAALCGSAWTPEDINNMMTDADEDGIYTITYTAVPAGEYEFKVTDGTWNNAWPGENYQFTLVMDADVTINFNSADGSIEVVSDGIEVPVTEPFVPGVREYCLVGYINDADYGCNDDYENVGEYIFVNGTLTATFAADSYIFVKTTDNANWLMTGAYTEETSATFVANGTEKMMVPGGVEVTFTLVENEDGSVTVSYVTNGDPDPDPNPDPDPLVINSVHVAGAAGLTGFEWDPTANAMTGADGIYTLTFTGIAAGSYEFKFVANGNWELNWSADAVMENGVVCDAYKNVMGNSTVVVPGNDATVTLTLDLSAMDAVTGEGAKCSVVISDYIPVEKEYCLVGYINGADYGCNEDWENVGEYIFVDGTLTATFTADSYIFVKSTDNANWYLTEAYTEEASATFVTTGTEKMKVPGNVELTFTLVENEDGSVTVSYVSASPASVTVGGAVATGADGDTTIELLNGEEVIATATVSGKDGTYTLENVAAGTYTLKVSKLNHVTRAYTVTVGAEDLTQDVKIHLIGDIDGNGKVNTGDVAKVNAHAKGTNPLTDEYMILCANVNGGRLNMGDVSSLYAHIKGTKLLY